MMASNLGEQAMSDIFREVDEAMQREKAAKMWKEYGPTLVLAAVVLVVGTGVGTAYRSWHSGHNKSETAELIQAADQKDIAAAMEKASADMKDGHRAVAEMNAAAKYAEAKNFAKAAELYGHVAGDKSAPDALRDLANILYVRSDMLATGDKADYKKLAAKIEPVANDKNSPFQMQAKLDAALLYGDGLKDYTKALSFLDGLEGAKDDASDSLKEKASALKHVYQAELAASPAATKDTTAASPTPAKQ